MSSDNPENPSINLDLDESMAPIPGAGVWAGWELQVEHAASERSAVESTLATAVASAVDDPSSPSRNLSTAAASAAEDDGSPSRRRRTRSPTGSSTGAPSNASTALDVTSTALTQQQFLDALFAQQSALVSQLSNQLEQRFSSRANELARDMGTVKQQLANLADATVSKTDLLGFEEQILKKVDERL